MFAMNPNWVYEHEEKMLRKEGKLGENEEYKPDKDAPFLYWVTIKPPVGPRGEWGTTTSPKGITPICIPKNAKSLDAVLRLLNFLSTEEGAFLWVYGVEGVDYDRLEKGRTPQPGPAVGDRDYKEYKQERGIGVTSTIRELVDAPMLLGVDPAEDVRNTYGEKGVDIIRIKAVEWANPAYVDVTKKFALQSPSAPALLPNLDTIRDQYFAKMIIGELSMDAWDEYVDIWLKQGGETILKEYTEAYRARK